MRPHDRSETGALLAWGLLIGVVLVLVLDGAGWFG